ncbi:MAG TPA: hypothetical protein VII28_05880 [Puia sp.]
MKQVKILLAVATIVIMGLLGCSKGSTGPAGPAGPAGPDSVMYSSWITLALTYNTTDSLYEQTILAPSITQGILDSGLVLSYIQYTDNSVPTAPVVHIQTLASLGSLIWDDYSVGKVNMFANVDLSTYLYRYVAIPGSKKVNGAATKIKGYTPTELKTMSYEQVQDVLKNNN